MPITNYGSRLVVQAVIGQALTTPDTLYIALTTASPNATSTGVSLAEPAGGSYARAAILNDAAHWTFDGYNLVYNTNDITFPTATGSWGRIGYWAICDALTNGNVLAYGTMNPVYSIVSGDTTKVLAGSCSFSVFAPESR